jgi:hypothetical protein
MSVTDWAEGYVNTIYSYNSGNLFKGLFHSKDFYGKDWNPYGVLVRIFPK